MPTVKCPRCGAFMSYDAYSASWRCAQAWCPGLLKADKNTPVVVFKRKPKKEKE